MIEYKLTKITCKKKGKNKKKINTYAINRTYHIIGMLDQPCTFIDLNPEDDRTGFVTKRVLGIMEREDGGELIIETEDYVYVCEVVGEG